MDYFYKYFAKPLYLFWGNRLPHIHISSLINFSRIGRYYTTNVFIYNWFTVLALFSSHFMLIELVKTIIKSMIFLINCNFLKYEKILMNSVLPFVCQFSIGWIHALYKLLNNLSINGYPLLVFCNKNITLIIQCKLRQIWQFFPNDHENKIYILYIYREINLFFIMHPYDYTQNTLCIGKCLYNLP